MARLFASKAGSDFFHSLKHIPVADLCLLNMDSFLFTHEEETQVAHDSRHNGIIRQLAVFFHVIAHNGHNLVAVHHSALLIHCHQSVSVAVKGKADIRFLVDYPCHQLFHMGRAAVGVNVGSVGHVMDGNYVAAKLSERFHGCIVSSPLRTVHNDFQLR